MEQYISTAVVLLILAVIIGLIIASMVKGKKQGKSLCGGDCAHCHGCSHAEDISGGKK